MKFIIDAQLPYILSKQIQLKGFDSIHTDDLPLMERTSDDEIRAISIKENRIVITKDSDFIDTYYVKGIPKKLLIITTGNIQNKELFGIIDKNWDDLIKLLEEYSLVELNNYDIIGHE